MRTLQAICLSFIVGCGYPSPLPDQPDGILCSFYYDKQDPSSSVFLCNKILNPRESSQFLISDPKFFGAKVMPNDSFKIYAEYISKLRQEIIECRSTQKTN